MQTSCGLIELANKLEELSLENKQIPKSEKNNLKFCDFPIDRASNSIIPLCLGKISFQPNVDKEAMLYHKFANRISEIPDIKVKIAKIIAEILEIEQPEKLFFRDGRWQPKRVSEGEKQTVEFLKQQLATLYTLLEEARLDNKIPEQLRDIGEIQLLKEVIANVRGGRATPDEDSARLLRVINGITEKSDILMAKLVEETNRDPQLSLLRQAIIDGNLEHVQGCYRNKKDNLSVEFGLVFFDSIVVIPDRMQEWVLQIAHGDHEKADKMREICQRTYWETKDKDIAAKAKICLTCFRTGKNLKTMIPKTPELSNRRRKNTIRLRRTVYQ